MARALADTEKILMKYNLTDWAWQLKAIIGHDIYRSPVLSEEDAARVMRAKLLVIVSRNDLMVNPEPSLALARALKAETLVLQGDCGHFSFLCEADKVWAASCSWAGEIRAPGRNWPALQLRGRGLGQRNDPAPQAFRAHNPVLVLSLPREAPP